MRRAGPRPSRVAAAVGRIFGVAPSTPGRYERCDHLFLDEDAPCWVCGRPQSAAGFDDPERWRPGIHVEDIRR